MQVVRVSPGEASWVGSRWTRAGPSAPQAQKCEPTIALNHFSGAYSNYKAHQNQRGGTGMQLNLYHVYQEMKLFQN